MLPNQIAGETANASLVFVPQGGVRQNARQAVLALKITSNLLCRHRLDISRPDDCVVVLAVGLVKAARMATATFAVTYLGSAKIREASDSQERVLRSEAAK
jgi:hypothetical protein